MSAAQVLDSYALLRLLRDEPGAEAVAAILENRCQFRTDWNDPMYRRIRKALPRGRRMSDYVTSLYVTARAP
ncbi:MAG: hypothetical protein HY343_05670 [Lentisphaerae bacterium]|nr:hypothetical protein [Lentisphaerota bacterium]